MKSLDDRIREAEQAYLQEVRILSHLLLEGSRTDFEIELQGKKMKRAQQNLRELKAQQSQAYAQLSSVA
jgi:hypothetical protein